MTAQTTPQVVAPRFLPWLRTGLAAHITEAAVNGLAQHDTAEASASLSLRSSGAAGERVDRVSGPGVRLRGPADVVGIDPAQVLRMDPADGVSDAEAYYFALVEFAAADLPWRFTPAAVADDRLQPWLALIVVEERDGVWLEDRGPVSRPVLHVDEAARELPDLAQCWAWAHVHADDDLAGGVAEALSLRPQNLRSRLLCPRRLTPGVSWLACVVPTFEAGRRAALGEPSGVDLGLAWASSDMDVRLPVYHSWRFHTRPGGDFESLVRRLRPRVLDGSVGRRDLDISDPGNGLPAVTGALVTYEGALVSPAGKPRRWPAAQRTAFKDALRDLLNAELHRHPPRNDYEALRDDPVIGPPVYAARQADTRTVPEEGADPVWLDQLTTEPAYRVAAAAGARIVRADQEAMMAAAWQYAADAREVNAVLTRGRFGWEAVTKAQPRFLSLPDASLVQIAGPALSRLRDPSGRTIRGALAESAVPAGLISPAFRRVTRTVAGAGGTAAITSAALADPVGFTASWTAVRVPPGADPQGDLERQTAERTAVGRARVETPHDIPASDVATTVRTALNAPASVVAMVNALLPGLNSENAIPARRWVRPVFTTPMYARLAALSIEHLIPGLGAVPDNTIGLLDANAGVVEAMLGGLNSELTREFAWREYPARPGGTWSLRFWDSGPGGPADITPIGTWSGDKELGHHRPEGTPEVGLVLLIKGALPQRYPDMRVYAVQAEWADGKRREALGGLVSVPVMTGRLGRDAAFYGFTLTEQQARGSTDSGADPGWFFVLEQHPGGTRFGLDPPRSARRGEPPQHWPDLSWSNLAPEEGELPDFVDVYGPHWMAGVQLRGNGGSDEWGEDAAAMARITLQRPMRVLTHASAMLPPPSDSPLGGGPLGGPLGNGPLGSRPLGSGPFGGGLHGDGTDLPYGGNEGAQR